MIEYFREKTQSKFSMLMMWLIAISFGLFGIQNYIIAGARSGKVASVDGHPITQSDVARLQGQWLAQLANQSKKRPKPEEMKALSQEALHALIIEKAKANAATKMGFYADKLMANKAILENHLFEADQQFSKARYQAILRSLHMGEKELFSDIAQQIKVKQFENAIVSTEFVLPNEVKTMGALIYEKRKISLLAIPSAYAHPDKVTAGEIANHYETHKADYTTPMRFKCDYLLLDRNQIMRSIKVTTQEISDYYHNNQGQFMIHNQLQPLSKVASQIKHRLISEKGQQQFTELSDRLVDQAYAEMDSLDETAKLLKLNKKTSDWIDSSAKVPQHKELAHQSIMTAALSEMVLKERQNSGLIPIGADKAVIIRIAELKPAQSKPINQVSKQIKEKLIREHLSVAKQAYAEKLAHLINSTDSPNKVQTLVKQSKLQGQHFTVTRVAKQQMINQAILNKAFSLNPSQTKAIVVNDDQQVKLLLIHTVEPGVIPNATARSFKQNLNNSYANITLTAVNQAIVHRANIKIHH